MSIVSIDVAEIFLQDTFTLLNGVINPYTKVSGIAFANEVRSYLGYLGTDRNGERLIVTGRVNLKRVLDETPGYLEYTILCDFIVHELYHSTQSIDYVRYKQDKEYKTNVEMEAEFNSTRFICNYHEWLSAKLNKPIIPCANELFQQDLDRYKHDEIEMMMMNRYEID